MGAIGIYLIGIITLIAFYAAVTMVLNIEAGWGGLWDLGVAGLMGLGGYFYVIATLPTDDDYGSLALGWPHWAGVLGAGVFVALVALLIGTPALRLRGEYFLITTLAFAEVVRQLAINSEGITRGTVGIAGVDRPFDSFVSPRGYTWVLLAMTVLAAVAVFFISRRIASSPHGRLLRALRDNEPLALSLGKNVARQRIITFAFVGFMYGILAPLYVWYIRSILPAMFASHLTFTAWTALVIGGIASLGGPAIGAAVLIAVTEALQFIPVSPEYATALSAFRWILLGAALILVLRARPQGLISEQRSMRSIGRSRKAAPLSITPAMPKPGEAISRRQGKPSTLTITEVTKRFGGLTAVNNVSLTARQGQITALIGPNGAGKTSLFNVITGFETADHGSIKLDDTELAGLAPWQIAQRGVVRTFQTPVGFPKLTVQENLLTAGSSAASEGLRAGLTGPRVWAREQEEVAGKAAAITAELGLTVDQDELLENLSSGDMKLVEFSRQLMAEPAFLLLDEPASGVNPANLDRLVSLLRGLVEKGIGIVVIDHNLSFIMDVADHVYVLSNGAVLTDGPPQEISQDERVIDIYLGSRA